ncbi:MAG: hypothetical protein KC800_27570 [Candidatus Eremiobacteraeota bacterium]|nr:hypothetical protein [Candidatus Eremiobacteraeota bacterium]
MQRRASLSLNEVTLYSGSRLKYELSGISLSGAITSEVVRLTIPTACDKKNQQ